MDGNLQLSDKLYFVVVPAYVDKLKSVYTQPVDSRVCRYPPCEGLCENSRNSPNFSWGSLASAYVEAAGPSLF